MKPLSLKARAIALLSQREHSVAELRRKLLRIQAGLREAGEGSDQDSSGDESLVDDLLNWLQAQGYLDEARFVESRVHARSQRWGQLRIRQELAQHGLTLTAEAQAELKTTELARARAVWQRKFGAASDGVVGNADEERALRAKQIRFLTSRGFAPEVVRAVLRGE